MKECFLGEAGCEDLELEPLADGSSGMVKKSFLRFHSKFRDKKKFKKNQGHQKNPKSKMLNLDQISIYIIFRISDCEATRVHLTPKVENLGKRSTKVELLK